MSKTSRSPRTPPLPRSSQKSNRRRPPASRPPYITALYDLAAQTDGDPSFVAGNHILLVKRTDSEHNWLSGKLNGVGGKRAQP
ncbi:hypothetical protein PtB15_13B393 [Puccinia triticina]|nr:hypothetical protein PtB15_13B393 [Puccinia triticina]